jgi:predicted phosphodiesterase
VKSAVKFINHFEETSADIGISNKYDYVVCGHIHQPEMRTISNDDGEIVYLNSGDWIENLTALEYHKGSWNIYRYASDELINMVLNKEEDSDEPSNNELFNNLLSEFKMMK